MDLRKTFDHSIIIVIYLLIGGRLSSEEIPIESRMIVKNDKNEIIKGAYLFPGQLVNGKKTKDGILIATPMGKFFLVKDEIFKDTQLTMIDISISGHEVLGNLKSFPILNISPVDKYKQILINLYQYVRDSTGDRFKHLIYSYILKSQTTHAQFSFKGKLNSKYIMLDRFSREVWGGTDVEMCLEVAVWDEKRLIISRHKSFNFEVTSD
jgi:hypothetical protein